jgi:hypothetical protein
MTTRKSTLQEIFDAAYAEFFATDLDVGEADPNDAAERFALRAVAEAAWDQAMAVAFGSSGKDGVNGLNPFRSVPKEQQ